MNPVSDRQLAKSRNRAIAKKKAESADRWANRDRKKFFYDGETLTVKDWCERIGIPHGTFYRRIHDGWPMSRVVNTPSKFAVQQGETHRACAACGEVYPIEEYIRSRNGKKTTKRKCTACEYQIRARGIEIGRYGVPGKFDKLIMSDKWPGHIEEELSGFLSFYGEIT